MSAASLALAILLLPVAVACGLDLQARGFWHALDALSVSLGVLGLPLLFLPIRTWLFLASPLLVVVAIELLHLGEFHSYVTMGGIAATIETSFNEAFEFIRSHAAYPLLGLALGIAYFALANRVPPKLRLPPLARGAVVGAAAIGLTLAPEGLEASLKHSYPLSFANSAYYYAKERALLDRALAERIWSFGTPVAPEATEREIHVLVIGETSRAASWSVYGYARPTSPRTDALRDAGELVAFADVTSPSALTRYSVPMMLTRATARDVQPAHHEFSLLSLFRRAGFEVYWLSNQKKYGNHNRVISEIAMETSVHDFLNLNAPEYERGTNAYDEVLLPALDAVLATGATRQLVVLHTLGSHFNYHYRYPDRFARFGPVLGEGSFTIASHASEKQAAINSYDNSILYTDHVLAEIIERVRATGAAATVTFVSDHGENLYDDEREIWGHGLANPTPFSVHVPLLVWTSNAYRNAWPERAGVLASHARCKVSLDALFYTLPDLAGIAFEGADPSRSLVSPGFEERPRYVLTAANEIRQADRLR